MKSTAGIGSRRGGAAIALLALGAFVLPDPASA